MNIKRFIMILLMATVFFVAGFVVGRFVMPRQVHITMVDINKLVDIIERYNKLKYELDEIKGWNENAIIEPESEEEEK